MTLSQYPPVLFCSFQTDSSPRTFTQQSHGPTVRFQLISAKIFPPCVSLSYCSEKEWCSEGEFHSHSNWRLGSVVAISRLERSHVKYAMPTSRLPGFSEEAISQISS